VSDSVAGEIAKLPTLTRQQLRAKWRVALKQPAPPHLRKQLLVPMLAYKLQEQAYGGLKPHVKRRLRELAVRFAADPKQDAAKLTTPARMKPGTRLIREWQGESHHVTVSERGFEYNGRVYASPTREGHCTRFFRTGSISERFRIRVSLIPVSTWRSSIGTCGTECRRS
jgi:hypothetical protein